MRASPLILALTAICTTTAAEEVGIQFDSMKVGTRLTTTTVGFHEATYIQEYSGQKNGYHRIQNHKLLDDGSTKPLNLVSYDNKGRKVFSVRKGRKNTYTPYSCHYVVGSCKHTYEYYNPLTKKNVVNESKFQNRLEGDTLILGVFKSDGSMFEVPYKLGPHRLRVSSEYNNALGKPAGFKFVDLLIP